MTDTWQESILAFGADLQKGFNTVAPWISPIYGGFIGLSGGYGQTFGTIVQNIETGKTPIQTLAKDVGDAWESTLHWGFEVQQGGKWFIEGAAQSLQGLSEFAKTAGGFIEALTGGKGFLGQIGALLPVAVIGLIALMLFTGRKPKV